ncbi:MAG: DUF362 domain-containing protein [Deltaproteobacteria bacterium]|nr:MAG: DUF362 domain-containing protein [Deltaproteobacteria bacterium]
MAKARVAVLRTTPETVLADYRRLCELAGLAESLEPSATTILKDNITWHFVYPGVNTTPWQLEGTILALREAGFSDLVAVHNHTVVTIPERGEEELKFGPIYERFGIALLYNFKPEHMTWIPYHPKRPLLALPKVFGDDIRIPDFFIGKNIVHLPTGKTHAYTQYTGALKNAFGGLLNYKRHYTHTWIHETLVDLLIIAKDIHPGMFATMDGTTAGAGAGPRTVEPHDKHVILASADLVAIDSIAATLMGMDWSKIPCISLAHEMGLGVGDPRDIEVVGDEDVAEERWNFKPAVNVATGVGRMLWFDTPLKHIQNLFFHTPLVNIFIFASELYHDAIWYRFKGRRVVGKWLRESPWGRLFERYPR